MRKSIAVPQVLPTNDTCAVHRIPSGLNQFQEVTAWGVIGVIFQNYSGGYPGRLRGTRDGRPDMPR